MLLLNIVTNAAIAIEPDQLRAKLAKAAPNLGIDAIADSILEGFYQVRLVDGSILHVTADGEYFVYGDLYALRADDIYNYTEEDRKKARLAILNSIDESSMIVFAPFGEQKRRSRFSRTSTADTVENCIMKFLHCIAEESRYGT